MTFAASRNYACGRGLISVYVSLTELMFWNDRPLVYQNKINWWELGRQGMDIPEDFIDSKQTWILR